jgi:hypothetical protein
VPDACRRARYLGRAGLPTVRHATSGRIRLVGAAAARHDLEDALVHAPLSMVRDGAELLLRTSVLPAFRP